MSTWERNLAVIRKRWPRVAKALKAASVDGCQLMQGTPAQGLVYNDRQVTSAFDLLNEAKWQAEGLDRDAEAVYCYGIGLGHLPAVLAARHKLVCVVIMNVTIARAAMEALDQPWLKASHVGLCLAEEMDTLHVPFACAAMECRMADRQAFALRDRLFAQVNKRFVDDCHFMPNAPRDSSHVEANRVHVSYDHHVSTLFSARHDLRVAIVGGGPSLQGEYEWLREQQASGMRIICTTSVLRVLLGQGITPDIAVIVDTAPTLAVDQLTGVDMEQTRGIQLVYHPTVTPEFPSAWLGPRYYYNNPSELYTSGTVMHTAAALAVLMGASEVHMVGLDFCYPAGKSHAEGTPDFHEETHRPSMFETVDGNGQRVYTDPNLAQYHRHLEDFIEHAGQGVHWVKRGRSGVSVRGAAWA